MRDQAINDKAKAVQEDLEVWAKETSILQPGERIVFSMKVERVGTVVQGDELPASLLPLKAFFTHERFREYGYNEKQYGRWRKRILSETYSYPSDTPFFATMHDFLQVYPDARTMVNRLPNIGRKGAVFLGAVIQAAGLPFDMGGYE